LTGRPGPLPRPPNTAYIHHYTNIGCFQDNGRRALSHHLGNFYGKSNVIAICYRLASRRGYKMFSVQNGGQCFSGGNAHATFRKYGKSSSCRHYKGGPWANDVYSIKPLSRSKSIGWDKHEDMFSATFPINGVLHSAFYRVHLSTRGIDGPIQHNISFDIVRRQRLKETRNNLRKFIIFATVTKIQSGIVVQIKHEAASIDDNFGVFQLDLFPNI
ncbi:predicted protein, partial [Nematostella vectensis]